MSVSESDVRNIASLARLRIADERMPVIVRELNGILGHMDVLQRVNLGNQTEQTTNANGMPLRADVPGSVPLERAREEFAPQMRDGFFLVPRLDTHGDAASGANAESTPE